MAIALQVYSKNLGLQRHLDLLRLHRRTVSVVLSVKALTYRKKGPIHTSLVDECNMRIFFAVMMCCKAADSKSLISMKLGSNARR